MRLTREELILWLPLFQALIEGKKLQYHNGAYINSQGEIIPDPDGWSDWNYDFIDFSASPLNHCQITNPINKFRVKEEDQIISKNSCIGCKYHCVQGLLDGTNEWTCSYSSCKYNFANVNPKESE